MRTLFTKSVMLLTVLTVSATCQAQLLFDPLRVHPANIAREGVFLLVLEDRWQRATSGRKRAFTSRFVDIEAQGGTEPRQAIEHAFTKLVPVPDEIHFMTDGQIPTDTPRLLLDLNGGRIRTVVHTYAFGDSSGGAVLERIAAEHGGQYRFVPDRP